LPRQRFGFRQRQAFHHQTIGGRERRTAFVALCESGDIYTNIAGLETHQRNLAFAAVGIAITSFVLLVRNIAVLQEDI
jgi:hypothetical protein